MTSSNDARFEHEPVVARAIQKVQRAHARATGKWGGDDEADEAEQHAREALAHLDAGRYDQARASAELAVELDEAHGSGATWRDFGLLVEEATETALG